MGISTRPFCSISFEKLKKADENLGGGGGRHLLAHSHLCVFNEAASFSAQGQRFLYERGHEDPGVNFRLSLLSGGRKKKILSPPPPLSLSLTSSPSPLTRG